MKSLQTPHWVRICALAILLSMRAEGNVAPSEYHEANLRAQTTSHFSNQDGQISKRVQYELNLRLDCESIGLADGVNRMLVRPRLDDEKCRHAPYFDPEDLNHPFGFEWDRTKGITLVFFPKDTAEPVKNFWKEILSICVVYPIHQGMGQTLDRVSDHLGDYAVMSTMQQGNLYRQRSEFRRIYDVDLSGSETFLKSRLTKLQNYDICIGYDSENVLQPVNSFFSYELELGSLGKMQSFLSIEISDLRKASNTDSLTDRSSGPDHVTSVHHLQTPQWISEPLGSRASNAQNLSASHPAEDDSWEEGPFIEQLETLDAMYLNQAAVEERNEAVNSLHALLGPIHSDKYRAIEKQLLNQRYATTTQASLFSILAAGSHEFANTFVRDRLTNTDTKADRASLQKHLTYFKFLSPVRSDTAHAAAGYLEDHVAMLEKEWRLARAVVEKINRIEDVDWSPELLKTVKWEEGSE